MEWIAQLPKLEFLNFDYTPVGDAGFAKLAGLASLAELHLDRTNISDSSIDLLSGLKGLRYIDLYHTLVSEKGMQRLIKALPGCKINWDVNSTRTERRS